jgi:hypothetical protein
VLADRTELSLRQIEAELQVRVPSRQRNCSSDDGRESPLLSGLFREIHDIR